MKIFLLFLTFISFILFLSCQPSYQKFDNGIDLKTKQVNLRVQFYNDNIIRIIKWNHGASPDKKSLIIVNDAMQPVFFRTDDLKEYVLLTGKNMSCKISKMTGAVEFFNADDAVLLKEENSVITPAFISGEAAYTIQQNYKLSDDEGIYGLGQNQNGVMNYRGKQVTLVQANTDVAVPFVLSTKSYGILWDNYSKTIFKDSAQSTSLWSDVADNIDYYFISGSSPDKVIAGYRELTGAAPMYGKYAYGYWQSKEHYQDRAELLGVVNQFRQRRIPIDNIIQDWDYWDNAQNWGQLFFSPTKYPNPKEMIDIIHKLNFHIMISIWPGLGPATDVYKDMAKKGYLFKPVGWAGFKYYDAYIPDANNIYWSYAKKGLFDIGIDAWWIDSTEPDIVNALTKDAEEYEMKKVDTNYLGTWARYLNTYSLLMTQSIYENQRKDTEQKRVYILTRSGFAGQQRYASTTWSGDIGANWQVYQNQIIAGLNFCMSGIPYWTFDIGAFVIGAYDGVFSEGGNNPAYWELYTRMYQFGAFSPIFRSHGSETPREIWHMGGETSPFYRSMLKFDNLRYRLLPYIYSLAWQVTDQGYTIMRGLAMDFSRDKQTYDVKDQFMFGPALMACPVTDYMYNCPPQNSVLIAPEYFKDKDGNQGLTATYAKDTEFKNITLTRTDPNINIMWYTGRPEFVTDSTYGIKWEGKLLPKESGPHQFHTKCFDDIAIYLNGKPLQYVYRSTERRTEIVNLEAGKAYDFMVIVKNNQTGAARALLYWKTPSIFATEKGTVEKEKTRSVYLPQNTNWYDFWTGETFEGGKTIIAQASIDKIPLYVKSGSILPMGPFLQYATEKPADPIELRIYPGADGALTLYEDENDNYNYEKGVYAAIDFIWDDADKKLTILDRKGDFPGMLKERTFQIVLVDKDHGTDIDPTKNPDKTVRYAGEKIEVIF
jgi:alpha-D-xyloside xylohydrolase